MNKKSEQQVKDLRNQGVEIWSVSRLNSYNDCAYGYKNSYVGEDRTRGKDNIYSIAGSEIHDILEDIHNDKREVSELKGVYDGIITKSQLFDIKFPNENIENNWRGDIEHFVEHFEKIDKKMITEKHFLFEIIDGIWLQGYIDAMYAGDDGQVTVLDWKTSSKFTGQSLTKAGRQLLIYKMAVEATTDRKVDKVAWFMIKYVYVKYGNRKSMKSRRKWVEETKNPILKALKKTGEEDFVCELMMDEAIRNNNLDNMPKEIQEMFTLEDCILYYDVTEENMVECLEYIAKTVEEISKDDEFSPVTIDRGTEFFCNVLCNHRDTCKYLKAYRNNEPVVNNDIIDMDKLFG